jgi:hypothetical protein
MSEFFHILTDPAHMAAEGVTEGIFFLLGVIYLHIKLKIRDRKHDHAG